jgi:HAD superfamily hydrolase (TIGR01509 family)
VIKLVVFDMDGVLVDAKELHYQALNQALRDHGYTPISREEQASIYEALPTKQKLRIYSERNNLPVELHGVISTTKQQYTLSNTAQLVADPFKIELLRRLRDEGRRVFVASNSIPESVHAMLSQTGLRPYIEVALSNKHVEHCKPSPEIYHHAMSLAGVAPSETLIVEDSPVGRMAAIHSGAHLCAVADPSEVTYARIQGQIDVLEGRHVQAVNMQVLVPMAGAGSRFAAAGYTFPKPLIEVNGKPMIQTVVDNLAAPGRHIFIVQAQHYHQYALEQTLQRISPDCRIIQVDRLTDGAACTALLAKPAINNDCPLLIANSDQFMDWDAAAFYQRVTHSQVDGAILTFRSTHPKWSYVRLDENGYVTELAEKRPISNIATVGVYYWAKGSDFVKYAEQMIRANRRVNNEFYVAPVYNEAIADGKKIVTYDVPRMWGLGTPEDLTMFLEHTRTIIA